MLVQTSLMPRSNVEIAFRHSSLFCVDTYIHTITIEQRHKCSDAYHHIHLFGYLRFKDFNGATYQMQAPCDQHQ